MICPGCHRLFDQEQFDEHTAGCAKLAGSNATRKHTSIIRLLADLCDQACVDYTIEPRDLQAYRCHGCGALVAAAARDHHSTICAARFSRTGPDLRITWPNGASTVYDVTVARTTAPSYGDERPAHIVANKVAAKNAFYGPLLGDEPFVVLPARALGKVEDALRNLVRDLCLRAGSSPKDALENLSVALARGVGLSLVEARRRQRE